MRLYKAYVVLCFVVLCFNGLGRTYKPLGRTYKPLGRTYKPLGRTYKPLGRTYKPLGHKRELRSFHSANKVVKYLNNKGIDCYATVIRSTVKPRK